MAGFRVLLVDDDPSVLERYAGTLAAHNRIALVIASSGREAERCVAEEPADALVLDLNLPDTDGITLLAVLREAAGQRVPAILLSGHLGPVIRAKAVTAGFDDFLEKPVDDELLQKTLFGLLRR
jgi:DNA-binding response OmpR family regulator